MISTNAMTQFMERVRQAQRSRSKQIVMSIEEATDLTALMGQLLIEKTELMKRIDELRNANEVIEVSINGGGFK